MLNMTTGSLAEKLEQSQVVSTPKADAYLTFSAKAGEWVMGDDCMDKELAVIVVDTISHGFIDWDSGDTPIKNLAPFYEAKPNAAGQDSMACMVVFDATSETPVQAEFSTSSMGGRDALAGVLSEVSRRQRNTETSGYLYPEVELGQTSYVHKKYGKINKPELTITRWLNPQGEEYTETKAISQGEVAQEEVATTRRRRRG